MYGIKVIIFSKIHTFQILHLLEMIIYAKCFIEVYQYNTKYAMSILIKVMLYLRKESSKKSPSMH